ncbi:protein pns1 [Anaeramoeba flamelloides]|uniref:Choline transporter-like protein n=1 Tax=Anaeramoeba flamelloides TaxID=1746091 RepID=A0ABQ8Y516_9EUKA|nr:protein pns1 [Anaeramoeba flamelloides]
MQTSLTQQEHQQGGMVGSNFQQNNTGMNQGQMGMNQGQMGMNQGQMGMNQGQMGMNQGQMGMNQGQMGMNQGQMGMNYNPQENKQSLLDSDSDSDIPEEEFEEYKCYDDEDSERFKQTKWRDVWAAVVFWAALIALYIVGYTVQPPNNDNNDNDSNDTDNNDSDNTASVSFFDIVDISYILLTFAVMGVLSIFLSFAWLKIMQKHAKALLKFVLISNSIWLFVIMVVFFFVKNYVGGVLFGIFFLISLLLYKIWSRRIPFAKVMLEAVVKVTKKYPSMINISLFFGVIIQVVWFIAWAFIAHRSSQINNRAFYFWVVLMYYWVSTTITNVVHVTCCGVFGNYYFLKGEMPEDPTMKSFKRATTKSFGSICFGSLVIAIIKTIRAMVRSQRNSNNGFARCIALCLLACIEWIAEWINAYALVHVAVYGKGYIKCAKATFRMLKQRGVMALINDDLIGKVLVCAGIISGLIVGIVSMAMIYMKYKNIWIAFIFAFIGIFIGIFVTITAFSVVSSGVMTYFVLFAEAPSALKHVDKKLYKKFMKKYKYKF